MNDDMLNVRQTAQRLGVHKNTVRNWANSGRLPFERIRPGGIRRFRVADVERFRAELVGLCRATLRESSWDGTTRGIQDHRVPCTLNAGHDGNHLAQTPKGPTAFPAN